jgi:hypothetical protein
MPRVDLQSTSLSAATYQEQSASLELEFRSGAIYRYIGVPAQVYQELLHSESKAGISTSTFGMASRIPKSIPRAAAQLGIPLYNGMGKLPERWMFWHHALEPR